MTNGIKNQSPDAWSNILFITNFQVPGKGRVIPDIREKDISRNSNSRKSSK